MNRESRWVVDTNVLVSAMLFEDSIPGRAVLHLLARGQVLISEASLQEVREVLNREKFKKYVSFEDRELFLTRFIDAAEMFEPTVAVRACRDPRDDKYLELAVGGKASGIITGDEDLLILHPFQTIPILTPADYLSLHSQPPDPVI
jgi:putative PIN family toxin of toxin-antitoxin system